MRKIMDFLYQYNKICSFISKCLISDIKLTAESAVRELVNQYTG